MTGKIIMLEPRRIAARAAAERMASNLGERVGETVGLRVRAQTLVSAKTRLEIVTEGVFTRMILDDPGLAGVALVIFDEFHERSLDADLSLALVLDAASALREDLRLLVMSATLDGARVAKLLDDAPVIVSEGRAFPVETHYLGRKPGERIEAAVATAVLRALAEENGSILAFLPGQGEIKRTAALLAERIGDPKIEIAPLYSAIDRAAQQRAIAPVTAAGAKNRAGDLDRRDLADHRRGARRHRLRADPRPALRAGPRPYLGWRRCGFPAPPPTSGAGARAARSPASAIVSGRRPRPVRWRLSRRPKSWRRTFPASSLDLAAWGVRDPAEPPMARSAAGAGAERGARAAREIGAIDADGALTPEGKAIARLALPPRLGRMMVAAAAEGAGVVAGRGRNSSRRARAWRRFARPRNAPRPLPARALAARRRRPPAGANFRAASRRREGRLAARNRLRQARSRSPFPTASPRRAAGAGEFLMANGRAAMLEPHEALAREPFLAVAEIAGRAGAARIVAAAALSEADLESVARHEIASVEEVVFDRERMALRARKWRRLGAIVLAEQNLPVPAGSDSARALAEGIAALEADGGGIGRLPFTKALAQWRDRVAFLRRAEPDDAWPDLSDKALARSAGDWLAPFIEGRSSLSAIAPEDVEAALKALLPFDMQRRLEAEAPTHFETPAGSRIALDYAAEGGPTLSVRVQELYGLARHPALARGKARADARTAVARATPDPDHADLPGFWRGSWAAVKAEMKGRYPRHLWPDDPSKANLQELQLLRKTKPTPGGARGNKR